MLPRDALVVAVQELPRQPRQRLAFRLILARYAATALSSIGSVRAGGRFNMRGEFEALYLASSPVTALREVEELVETADGLRGVKGPPRILLSIEYGLQAVVDLTESAIQHLLATRPAELCAPWRALDAASLAAATQVLGTFLFGTFLIRPMSRVSAWCSAVRRVPSTDG